MARSVAAGSDVVHAPARPRTRQRLATAWAVSAVAARRAGALGPPPRGVPAPLHRGLLRGTVWVETLAGFGRVHPDRVAVVSVVPPRWRDQRRFFAIILAHDIVVVAALALFLVLWWPAFVVALAAIGLVMAAVVADEHRPRSVRAQLDAVTPSAAHHVRNFFAEGAHKGAGRVVLAAACREADEAGHAFALDTVTDRLVVYYGEFGFEVRATVALTRGGETVRCRRMVREPRVRPEPAAGPASTHARSSDVAGARWTAQTPAAVATPAGQSWPRDGTKEW